MGSLPSLDDTGHGALTVYRLFGLRIATDLPFPELPEALSGPVHLTGTALVSAPADAVRSDGARPGPWAVSYVPAGLMLSRDGVGAFLISPDGRTVGYRAAADASVSTLRAALIDQVMPRALAHQGQMIVHAACLGWRDRAVVLLGRSGMGKSSLSLACSRRGHAADRTSGLRLLGDDSVRIDLADRLTVRCAPSYVGARLCADSAEAIGGGLALEAPGASGLAKFRYRPTDPTADGQAARDLWALVQIERVFDECAADGAGSPIELVRVPPTEAAAMLMAHGFLLDPDDRVRVRERLRQAATAVTRLPVYRLRYPSGFARLPAVCERLAELLRANPLDAADGH